MKRLLAWLRSKRSNRFNMTVIRAVSAGDSSALVYIVGSPTPFILGPKCGIEMNASVKGCELIHIDAEGLKNVIASFERT